MNKTTLLLSILALTSLLLASCRSSEQKANKVAYNYSYALANYDLQTAEQYATDETIETTLAMAHMFLSKLDTSYINSDTPASILIDSLHLDSDTSATAFCTKNTPIKHNLHFQLQLRKRDGSWLAHAPMPIQQPSTSNDTLSSSKPQRLPQHLIDEFRNTHTPPEHNSHN